jgi:hypothetical protein
MAMPLKLEVECKTVKAIALTGSGGSWVCESSEIPHFLDNRLLTNGGEIASLTRPQSFTPRRFLELISVTGLLHLR